MTNEQAIEKAKNRLSMCDYQSDTLNNPGLMEAYRREGEWLRVVLRLAMQATDDVCNHRAERTGRWVPVVNTWTQDEHEYGATWYKCDQCGRLCETKQPYCHCGAHMIGG